MSESGSQRQSPKAVIHKRILEVADTNPNASIEAIADEISGVSPDVVERVLDAYGDPGEEPSSNAESTQATMPEETKYDSPGLAREEDRTAPQALEHQEGTAADEEPSDDAPPHHSDSATDAQTEDSDMSETDSESVSLDPDEVSKKQRNVLQAIHERPEATQQELAEQFNVTRATINRWVNDIPGFEWQDRQRFVAHHFDTTEALSDGGSQSQKALDQHVQEFEPRLDELEQELAALQDRIDALEQATSDGTPTASSPIDSDLFAKIIRACLADDRITEDEEERILTALR